MDIYLTYNLSLRYFIVLREIVHLTSTANNIILAVIYSVQSGWELAKCELEEKEGKKIGQLQLSIR